MPWPPTWPRSREKVVSEAEAYLVRVRKRLTRRGRVTVETSVWYGPAAHAIVEAARIRKVDQMVMTAHGAAVQTPSGDANQGRRDEDVPTHPARDRLLRRLAPALARKNRAPLSVAHALPPSAMIVGDGFASPGTYEVIDRRARQHARSSSRRSSRGRGGPASARRSARADPACRAPRTGGPDSGRDPRSERPLQGAPRERRRARHPPRPRSGPRDPGPLSRGGSAMLRLGRPIRPSRSKQAGQPPLPVAAAPRVRRWQKSAKAAVRKDTTVLQSLQDPRARWPASKPKFPKR